MLTIRLQRAGKKNKPEYRVILADKTAAAQKKFTEILGSYNPHTKVLNIRSQERLDYWMKEQHVPLSATVQNLFVTKEIIKGTKTKAFTIPKKEVAAEEVKEDTAPVDAPDAPAAEAGLPVGRPVPARRGVLHLPRLKLARPAPNGPSAISCAA